MRTSTRLIAIFILATAALTSACKNRDPRGRLGDRIACTPGVSLDIACGAGCGLGSCAGDPQLHVCEGSVSVEACAANRTLALAFDDDRCGSLCPGTTVVCPPTGALTVAPLPFMTSEYRCQWEARELGGVPGASDAGR